MRSLLTSACIHSQHEHAINLPSLLHCLESVVNAAVSINAYLSTQPNVKLAVSGALLNDMLGAETLGYEAKTWGATLAQQSRAALDELMFFAPGPSGGRSQKLTCRWSRLIILASWAWLPTVSHSCRRRRRLTSSIVASAPMSPPMTPNT